MRAAVDRCVRQSTPFPQKQNVWGAAHLPPPTTCITTPYPTTPVKATKIGFSTYISVRTP